MKRLRPSGSRFAHSRLDRDGDGHLAGTGSTGELSDCGRHPPGMTAHRMGAMKTLSLKMMNCASEGGRL